EQSGHGSSMRVPVPEQSGQGREKPKAPRSSETSPLPLQVPQVRGLVPGFAPEPWQLVQGAALVSRMGTVTPLVASRNSRVISVSTSAPRLRLRWRRPPPPPKPLKPPPPPLLAPPKTSPKMSEILNSSPIPVPPLKPPNRPPPPPKPLKPPGAPLKPPPMPPEATMDFSSSYSLRFSLSPTTE